MTYRFGRIAKVWLRRTGVPHPNWTGRPDVDPVMYEPREMIDPEASTERVYAAVPGLPETYGSLGYASMAIGSMDRAIQARRRYGHWGPPYDEDDSTPIKSTKTRARRGRRRRRR